MIKKDLPLMLDLIALCLESGLELSAAIRKIVSIEVSFPLKGELQLLLQSLDLYPSRVEALRHWSQRIPSEEIQMVNFHLAQTFKQGTPLAPALRSLSQALRHKQFSLAERRALQAPLKILFPLLFLLFPAVMMILLTPLFLMLRDSGFF